ncbi:MAG: hypothetical protein Q9163_004771 [Psora crenata]
MSKKEHLTDEELLAQLEDIGDTGVAKTSGKPSAEGMQSDADLLEELRLPERSKSSGRHTPRPNSASTTPATKGSPRRSGTDTPPSNGSARSSEEKTRMRRSGESGPSLRNSFTPASTEAEDHEPENIASVASGAGKAQSSGGGWWSTITSTATAAVKQAEALAKEIQRNEEAQRWAEQVKGNVGTLRGIGMLSLKGKGLIGILSLTHCIGGELRSRAIPTFTNILHTLAPPISSHERLQIHITHDMVGYPSLDPLIYSTFSRVMAQVDGGDLIVIQRGQESGQRRSSDGGFTSSSSSGWSDGPWWRQAAKARNLGAVKGLVEGTKFSKVSAESYAMDYFSTRGGVEGAAKHATEVLSESNPVRSSDIFLAVQAIREIPSKDLFDGQASEQKKSDAGIAIPEEEADEGICFAIYLHDPIHGITYSTISQSLPEKWIHWLDASASADLAESTLPEEIADIVNTGGVDPREWVAEWVEEALTLSVGVVAQRYVARRMGVGHGGFGKGKARQQALESGGGEAARAV